MKRAWYRLRLKQSTTGSRARVLVLGGGRLRFNLGQTDKSAEDYPEKLITLGDEQLKSLSASGNWDIRHAKAPQKTLLSQPLVQRRIGSNRPPDADGKPLE